MGSGHSCPRVNTTIPENGSQWDISNGKWNNVKLGWLIAGMATLITTIICLLSTYRHARHYHRPKEQRQIIRIMWMPLVFAIISFFSYRYYRNYVYYKLVFIVYEALCLMAFLALMLSYIGSSTEEQIAVMRSKDKRPLPWPAGCWRYRPSKPYFLYALNLSVLQYAFMRPLLSIIAMICHAANVLCSHKMSPYFAYIYIEVVDFISISIALYGLVVLYTLLKKRLMGKRPLTKFICIKIIVALTYYQAFLFSALVSQGLIKPNGFWSRTNIADGLNAIVICIEMVVFSGIMYWAYPVTEYRAITLAGEAERTKPWIAFGQALNFWDFVSETYRGIAFFIHWLRGKRSPQAPKDVCDEKDEDFKERDTNLDIQAAFNRPHRPESMMVQRSRASASACNGNSDTVQERSAASSRQHSYLDMRDDQDDDDSDKPDQPPPVEVRRKKSVGFAVPKEASPEIVSYQPRTFDHRSSMLARTAPGAVTMPQLPSQAAYSIDALVAMPPSTAPDPRYDVDQRSRVIVSSLPSTSTTYSTNLTPIIEVPSSQGRESRSSASSMQAQPSRSFIDTENSLSGSDQSKQESQPRLMSHTAAIVASPVAMPLSGAEEEITDSLHYYMQADNPIEPDNERSGENGKEGVEPVLQSHLQAKIHTAEAGPTSEAHASNDSMKDPPQLHTTIPDEPFTFSPLKF